MTTARTYFVPTLIILLAGLIVSFAALPLANTGWAESFRTGSEEQFVDQENAEQTGEEEPETGGVAMMILPLIKVMLFMGVGVLLTMLVRWIIGLVNRFRRRA